jgi:hypothetical protein
MTRINYDRLESVTGILGNGCTTAEQEPGSEENHRG